MNLAVITVLKMGIGETIVNFTFQNLGSENLAWSRYHGSRYLRAVTVS